MIDEGRHSINSFLVIGFLYNSPHQSYHVAFLD
ncbi:hypothetical protein PIL02S_01723 [Paenibacillus illinoisensis]|uniref:Uncharacterized protein n=1 Tax=Paenibacillus illinoisensis TaxID=59845 RepID=A0A2W0D2K1_9BACL|nr:hypothetical protein PIL02S_01723 [Paenibacillus illinoisensis]